MTPDLPSGTLTFLFSDVEGSTRLLTSLGDRFPGLLEEHQRLIRASLEANRGIEVSTEGDSFFAVFRAASDAVAAAARIQRELAAHPWPPGGEFRVRIGLHSGQAVLAGDDYVGIDINRAARIADAANGAQVLLSDDTRQASDATPSPGLAFVDLGRHRLRDVGVVHLWELMIAGLETPPRPPRTLEAHPSNLPIDATPLIDRSVELAALLALVREQALVTITGPGGIGKSRLAIQVARDLLTEYPDGVYYLDLAPLDRVDTAATELAAVLGLRVGPTEEPTSAILEHLRSRQALLVLETADRLAGVGDLLARLAATCRALRVVVTARSPLRLRAERTLPVEPLGLPGGRSSLAAIAASPAVDLFVSRARAVVPSFELTGDNAAAVAGIVRRVDGLPLAVELAAARVRLLSPTAILARLERRLPLLSGGLADLPERQRALRDTIDWSYQLLDRAERRMLQQLSVFAGGFDLEAIGAVVGEDGAAEAVGGELETLSSLVDRSLVERVQAIDGTFRLLGTIREFAADELEKSGEAASTRERHARYWLVVATRQSEALDGAGEALAMTRLEDAADEFRAALRWTLSTAPGADPDHLALRLASALGRFWYLHGRVHEGAEWLDAALEADPDAPAELRATALHWSGVMADERRESGRATERFEAALRLLREVDDRSAIARELNSLGVVHRNAGDLDRAEPLLKESLDMRRRLGDRGGVATVLTNLGIVALDRDRVDDARAILEEAVELDRELGSVGGVAYSSSALATALLRGGRRAEALELVRSALDVYARLGDADGVAECLERLGEADQDSDPARAAMLLFAAREIRDRERLGTRPVDQGRADAIFAAVAAALTPDELAQAAAQAQAIDIDAAVAYATAGLDAQG